jgi:hypothetical protein
MDVDNLEETIADVDQTYWLKTAVLFTCLFVIVAAVVSWPFIKRENNYVSLADASCKPLWVERARNDPALECYLTKNLNRLCNPAERSHLAAFIRRYRREADTSYVATLGDVFKSENFGSATDEEIKISIQALETALMGGSMSGKEAPRAKRFAYIFSEDPSVEKLKIAQLNAALAVKVLPDTVFVQKIQYIGRAGYMSKWEFGWWNDRLVNEAFKGLQQEASACDTKATS